MRTSRAFTLIELLVVISIIALLSSVVLASLGDAREKARIAANRQFEAQAGRLAGEAASGVYELNECSGLVAGDRSGFGNNGALQNMAGTTEWSADVPYGAGCSLDFDGSNDQVRIANNFQFDTLHGPSAISVWFKADTLSSVKRIVTDNCFEWGIYHDGSNVVGGIYGTTANGGPISVGRWYHAVLSHEHPNGLTGTLVKLYVDGVLKGQTTWSYTNENGYNDNPYGIGADVCYPGVNNFDGKIDNVRIFTKALTASEAGKIYAEESAAHPVADGR